jgi:hypothetical protein
MGLGFRPEGIQGRAPREGTLGQAVLRFQPEAAGWDSRQEAAKLGRESQREGILGKAPQDTPELVSPLRGGIPGKAPRARE